MNKIYYLPYSQEKLAHSGVRGMKWGSNRWWTPDHRLTPAGREHYGYGPAREKKDLSGADFDGNTVIVKNGKQMKYAGLFKQKTPEEKAAAAEKKAAKSEERAQRKIDALQRDIQENEDAIVENTKYAVAYAKKAEEHRAIAEGLQKRSKDYSDLVADLEWTNARNSKKIEKLEREIERLKSRKVSEVEPKLSELNDQLTHVRDMKLEETETTLRDYFKSNNDYDAYQKWVDEHVG